MRESLLVSLLALFVAADGCGRTASPVANRRASVRPAVGASLRRQPLRFEKNLGQFDARVRFVARNQRLTLFLTDDAAVMALRRPAPRDGTPAPPVLLTMRAHDAVARPRLEARDVLPTRSNYFLGNDPHAWRIGVPSFGEVAYRSVRPGVDLVYHGAIDGQLEYDFVIAPGASPDITLDLDGADGLRIAADGALEVRLAGGVLRQPPPTVYQTVGGRRRVLRGAYRLVDRTRVGFAVAEYDRAQPLVIDPVLLYSSYLGGSGDEFAEDQVAVDDSGSVYVVGYTSSTNFPTHDALAATHGGSTYDGFVAKLTPAGDALAYATYLGGSGEDYVFGVAVDATGAAYVAGMTTSPNFPTKNPIQGYTSSVTNAFDVFVTKLSPSGDALVYSTYLGGHGYDRANCIAVDANGAAYVGGETYSTDFPTLNPLQASFAGGNGVDGFVAKLTAAGTALAYSTYLGGTQNEYLTGIAVDANGSAYVTGATHSTNFPVAHALQATLAGTDDAYVAKLTPAGDALAYGTYLGGSGEDYAYAVALDSTGAAYVVGQTASADFPTANALDATVAGTDAFVTKLTPDGSALAYSTFLGGSTTDWAYGVAVDKLGAVYVAGSTLSQDFPISHAFQSSNGGNFDGFVAKLTPSGNALAFGSYLGGSNGDEIHGVAVDATGAMFVAGWTYSTNFPTTTGAAQATSGGGSYDSFVAKIGYPPLVVTPSTATVPPRGAQTFVASGGTGEGYTWSLTTNASGGSVDSNGNYSAGPTGSVTDVVTLTDSAGATATATITVTAGISVMPSTPTTAPPRGSIQFVAAGGSGSGFTWSLSIADSGGGIDASTGAYHAGPIGSVKDTVTVTDSLGNVATAVVHVTAGVTITPSSAMLRTGGLLSLSASGGSGVGWVWSLDATALGTIDAATGWYAAGSAPGTNTIHVVDSLGNGADAIITVYAVPIDDLGASPPDDLATSPPDLGGGVPHAGCGCQVGRASAPVSSLPMLLLMSMALVRRRLRRRPARTAQGVSALSDLGAARATPHGGSSACPEGPPSSRP